MIRNIMNSVLDRFPLRYKKNSYSQCGEDRILEFIFSELGIINPTYIDIGAYHPFKLSNTALLYKKGNRGINIEPNPILFKKFLKYRTQDINLNMGISDKKGKIDFYIVNVPTLSTFSKETVEKYKKQGNFFIEKIVPVNVDTIESVINDYCNGNFPDFLSLDAEGIDNLILKNLDYDENSPKVICVETISFATDGTGEKDHKLISYLEGEGYLNFADTYINTIFVKEKIWRRKYDKRK